MDTTTITAPLSGSSVTVVTFTNPFHHSTHFTVSLTNDDSDQFCVLLKRASHILLKSGTSLDIPLLFAPDSMTQSQTGVVVTAEGGEGMEDQLSWTYPVVGLPQALLAVGGDLPKIIGRARERMEQRLVVKLAPGVSHDTVRVRPVTPGDKGGGVGEGKRLWERYQYRLVCGSKEEEEQRLFERSTGVRLVREEEEKDGTTLLIFSVTFMPPKPFRYLN